MRSSLLALLFLCGCGSAARFSDLAPTDPATIQLTETLISGSILLRRADGKSCGPPEVRQDEAVARMKQDAASIGATGLYKVRFRELGIIDGCLLRPAVRASGMAFHR